jgi:hypothetical protein
MQEAISTANARVILCQIQARTQAGALIDALSSAIIALETSEADPRTVVASLPPLGSGVITAHKRLSSAMYDRCSGQSQGIRKHVPESAFAQVALLLEDARLFSLRSLNKVHIVSALTLARESLQALDSACDDLPEGYLDPGFPLAPFQPACERRMREARVGLCRTQCQDERRKMLKHLDLAITNLANTGEAVAPLVQALGERLKAVKFYCERYGSSHYNNSGCLLSGDASLRRAGELLDDVISAAKTRTPCDALAAALKAVNAELSTWRV